MFLNEGLIKLPPVVLKTAISFFLEKYLAYLYHNARECDKLDETDRRVLGMGLKLIAKKHGLAPPNSQEIIDGKARVSRTKIKLKDIPDAYLKRMVKLHLETTFIKRQSLTLTIVFNDKHKNLEGDEEGVYMDDTGEIILSIKGLGLQFKDLEKHFLAINIKEITKRIEDAIGTIEHELTHLMQHKILKFFSAKQIEGTGQNSMGRKADHDTYYNSQIEFDPWVKSSIRRVKSLIDQEKKKMTPRQVFDIFTWSDGEVLHQGTGASHIGLRSAFYKALKKKDQTKWKKAVKLLSQEVL